MGKGVRHPHAPQFWGKAHARPGARHQWHPLTWHSLDVAACTEALLKARPFVLAALVAALGPGATPDGAVCLAVLLAAGHDIGKFSAAFQAQSPETCLLLGTAPVARVPVSGPWRHDNVGLAAWLDGGVMQALGLDMDEFDILPKLASAAAGHHGKPTTPLPMMYQQAMTAADQAAALDFLRSFRALVAGPPSLPVSEAAAGRASFILSGVITVADWLASAFPYASSQHDIARYWRYARRAARRRVERAGLVSVRPRPAISFGALFPDLAPTPLQRLADEMVLTGAPTLVTIQDAPGSGKTEAALTLAGRMMAAGMGSGVFFGLPTTATADAQARRQHDIRARLFCDTAASTMTLAHGRSPTGRVPVDLAAASRASAAGDPGEELADDRGDGDGTPDRLAWMADDRRRRLLADLCVGTIDQAMIAALPAKFSTVRLLGLVGKILIVDEAHSYDACTTALLASLLTFHAALGGSAILLSATLPQAQARRLAEAYAKGAGWKTPLPPELDDPAYPLVTGLSAGLVSQAHPARAARAPSDKKVRLVHNLADAKAAVLAAAAAGHCVAWIRNTVDQAIETGRDLAAQHGDVTVLHSRFPEARRSEITREVVRRFGKEGGAAERRGGIVVATSVIEQSLDLDFDLIVVDLRTMEGIIQALGRARRHSRDRHGHLLADGAPDERPEMAMIVLSPDPDGPLDASWYSRLLDKAAFVQPDTGALWRTAAALHLQGAVRYADLRGLVEGVVAPRRHDVETPAVFDAASAKAEGARLAAASVARNALSQWSPSTGYVDIGFSWDDRSVPTRLGEAIEVILVTRNAQRALIPLFAGQGWLAGLLRLQDGQARKLTEIAPEHMVGELRKLARYARVVACDPDGGGDGFRYDVRYGVTFGTSEMAAPE